MESTDYDEILNNGIKNININKTIISCPSDIICGKNINKEKRHELFGKIAGGSGSVGPEKYQRKKIEEGTEYVCKKTNMRINFKENELINISHPNKYENGFDFSEDFDGVQEIANTLIYINLKCICGKGGNQTRSLREVYKFVEGQLNVLLKCNDKNIVFANILDGDESYNHMDKYNYLISDNKYKDVKDKIYIGDLKNYFDWLNSLNLDI